MAVFFISQQILTNIAQINEKAKDNYLREFVRICQLTFLSFYGVMEYWRFFSSSSNSFTPLLRRDFERICENLLTHFRGLTEPLLWIQLVAEGSPSQRRTFGVAMTKARRVNVEGSVFQ